GRRDISELRSAALQVRSQSEDHRLRNALKHDGVNIIAEIKRASPSKGVINDAIDVAETAAAYQSGGAAAISVLTEEDFFKGSLDDLRKVRAATFLPILRKDFVFDEFQIYEAAEAGADAILLIVAMLDDEELTKLRDVAESELGIDALIEVHNNEELTRAGAIGTKLIGVNNRNLHSFDVSLDVSRELIKYKSNDARIITESGITSRDEIEELRSLGFDGFLIGETLMRTNDASGTLKSWI
ncbi:MAG TPA: indole-3-glycerol phosphate synthase TrpC, partial [Pyrinomonadaceae bacterium]|nr:indole-3-glycerol phosphate synthase TrpC [Pyrinomonadaceae bacterium]